VFMKSEERLLPWDIEKVSGDGDESLVCHGNDECTGNLKTGRTDFHGIDSKGFSLLSRGEGKLVCSATQTHGLISRAGCLFFFLRLLASNKLAITRLISHH